MNGIVRSTGRLNPESESRQNGSTRGLVRSRLPVPALGIRAEHPEPRTLGFAITAHPKINTISFTGGTVTGRKVADACAPLFKKVSLELGGKNPNIIFADADLDAAISESVRSSFANQGQICLCGSRVFVGSLS